jgi:hypothetical protein
MLAELERDQRSGAVYKSRRLTDAGANGWSALLGEALGQHDDEWLASMLRSGGYVRTHEGRRKPKGGFTVALVPYTAPETLAEGEFNRFYARGLCAQVLAASGHQVEVCRGKEVDSPRPESRAMLGQRLPAQALLDDLRTSQGVEPALGLPPGPDSGLTIRRCFG